MCKKQTSVLQSSAESEIIGAGLRLDGIPARFMGSDCFSLWKHKSDHDRTVQPVVN